MKKVFLLALMVIFLVGCVAPVTKGANMANYSAYLSTVNSEYFGAYENSGHVDGYSYGYVGNNNTLAGFYLGFKLPSTFPQDGGVIGDYTIDADDITSAILRLPEVNKGTRGNSPLTLKIAAITGEWNADAAFNTLPAISAVVDTTVIDNAIPSSSNYNTRDGYHAATYKITTYRRARTSDPWVIFFSNAISAGDYTTFYNEFGGADNYWNNAEYYFWEHLSTTAAYYSYYYLYHDIDIINVIKDAVANGATGLLLYFDVSSANYDRKVFTTPLETADSRRPLIAITFTDGSGATINLKMVVGAVGSKEFKQLAGLKMVVGEPGSKEWKQLAGLKMVVGEPGSKQWVEVYRA